MKGGRRPPLAEVGLFLLVRGGPRDGYPQSTLTIPHSYSYNTPHGFSTLYSRLSMSVGYVYTSVEYLGESCHPLALE